MRRLFIVILATFTSTLLAACSNPDDHEGEACGLNGTCPSGYSCGKDQKCHKGGTNNADAAVADAKLADANATPDANTTPDAKLPDATATPDAAPPADARSADAAAPIDAAPPIDATPVLPIAQITGGAENQFCQLMEKFTYIATNDQNATFLCGVGDALVACDAAGKTFTFAEGSTQVFSVRAVNANGQGPIVSRTCTVDGIAPVVTITKPANMSTQGGSIPVEFTVVEAHLPVVLACAVDDKPQVPCMSPMQLTLPAGAHKLVVTATDPAGNVGSATSNFTVVLTGPLSTISSPGEGDTTGPETDVVYSTGSGTTKVVCKLDGFEINCQLPLTLTFGTSGHHDLTVQAFNAAGVGGNIAMVGWFADASPPRLVTLTVVTLGPGTVKINFTLTDHSKITDIRCALDDGLFTKCGEGTTGSVTYTGLNGGSHVLHIFAEDEWGNSGQDDISSGTLPGTNINFPFEVVVGPGHLVLIGYDYWAPLPEAVPKLPGTVTPPDPDLAQLLINSVSQTPAIAFGRNVRVGLVNVVGGPTDEELNHIDTILSGLPLTFVPIADPVALESCLATCDVILVPDQNGAIGGGNQQANAFAKLPQVAGPPQVVSPLLPFLNHGGVVVVLDGMIDGSENQGPSGTFRVTEGLLDIDSVSPNFDNVFVPCNHADPILEGDPILKGDEVDNTLSLDAADGNSVAYTTFEPWITYINQNSIDNTLVQSPFVFHKWFGTAEAGPVAISMNDHENFSFDGLDVMYQDAFSTDVEDCETLTNGTAVHQMQLPALADRTNVRAGYVSIGTTEGTLPARLGVRFATVIGVEALDHIEYIVPQFNEVDAGSDEVTVNLPEDPAPPADTDSYRVLLGCGSVFSDSPDAIIVSSLDVCKNDEGSYSVIGEALDVNGEVLAYTIQNGVAADAVVNMPPWKLANVKPAFTIGTLTDIDNMTFVTALQLDDVQYFENRQDFKTPPATFSFYSDIGTGLPSIDSVLYETELFYNSDLNFYRGRSRRTERGPTTLRPITSLQSALLGRVQNAAFETEFTEVSYEYAGPFTGLDGGQLRLSWDAGSWLIVFPPPVADNDLTILPPFPYEAHELGSIYWPPGEINVIFRFIQLDDISWLSGYKTYRQHPNGDRFLEPARADFLFRRTIWEQDRR